MTSIRAIFLAVLTIFLNGCAEPEIIPLPPIEKESVIQNRDIGVYSVFPDEMHNIYLGITVFSKKESSRNVPDWAVNEFSRQQAVKHLQHINPTKDIGIIDMDIKTLKRLPIQNAVDKILEKAKQQGYRTALILLPASYENAEFLKPGYGVFNRTNLIGTKVCAYASFTLNAYDTKSKQTIDWQWGFNTNMLLGIFDNDGPCSSLSVAWKYNPTRYNKEELSNIEVVIKSKIDSGIQTGLKKLLVE